MSEDTKPPEPDEPPELVETREDDGIPIRGYWLGEPLPDLNELSRDRWREVLLPLSPDARRRAAAGVQSAEAVIAATQLVGELLIYGGDARSRALAAPPPRLPAGSPPATGAGRQVNFRLGPNEHARLLEAAKLFGMRPTALARVLTVRGVTLALHDERRRDG